MKEKMVRHILAIYEALDDDISTERLLAMTADAAGVEYADVVRALSIQHEKEKPNGR